MKNIDLNDARTFVVIAQEGTLTAAASVLHQPTSTVSRSLTRLERALGILLMQRSSRGLRLTDLGKEYLETCRLSLRLLDEGGDLLESRRTQPGGTIKVACPVTVARYLIAPVLGAFFARYPDLRVEIDTYSGNWDQEPREDVDVFFKLREPKESGRSVKHYPGTARGLFASIGYTKARGTPLTPEDLASHVCVGSREWTLTQGKRTVTPSMTLRVITSDPGTRLCLTVSGLGIAILPLWMAKAADVREDLVSILPLWVPEPITMCALFSGSARLKSKVKVLLDFLAEYIGTDQDPRISSRDSNGCFTDVKLLATSGP